MNENAFYTLSNIRKNGTDTYIVTEAGTTYQFNEETFYRLKNFIKIKGGLIADWYRSLSPEEQENIKRTGSFKNNILNG